MDNINKLLLTGATGHVGVVLAQTLKDRGHYVRAFCLNGEDPKQILHVVDEVTFGNVTDENSLIQAMKGMDSVIHCAGVITIGFENSKLLQKVNIGGTKNVISAAKKSGVKRLVYISSVHAIPEGKKNSVIKEIEFFDPKGVVGKYAKSKAVATQAVLEANGTDLETVVCMPSGVIGPGAYERSHIGQVVDELKKGSLNVYFEGQYNFVDVRDLSDGIAVALERGKSGQCYVMSGENLTVKEMIDTVADELGVKRPTFKIQTWFLKSVALFAELYYMIRKIKPLLTAYSLHTLTANCNFDNSKAKKELDFSPRNVKDSIREEVRFMKDNNLLAIVKGKKDKKIKVKKAKIK